MPTLAIVSTRGHCFKLFNQHCRVSTRKFFLTERVVEPWNSMPATVQEFSSPRDFKAFLKTVDFSTFQTDTLTNLTYVTSSMLAQTRLVCLHYSTLIREYFYTILILLMFD